MSNILKLDAAIKEILSACGDAHSNGDHSPFFFMIGAGVSSPQIPAAYEVIKHCRGKAKDAGDENKSPMDEYSYWLDKAYPQPKQRTGYLKTLIENKKISQANFRLAHLLLSERNDHPSIANVVVTTNFDDHLSRALTLFGKRHIICDHPATTQRITLKERKNLYLIHVHGSYHFYDCKNLSGEIQQAAQGSSHTTSTMASLLDAILRDNSPIVVGYSGWEQDVFMQALKRRLQEPLPYNLYWFCYRKKSLDALPSWLKDNPNARFVLPEERSKPITTGSETAVTGKLPLSAEAIYPAAMQPEAEPSLDARTVFDAMVSKHNLEAPKLTRDPLQSLIDSLHETFPAEDMESDDDYYSLKSVVERIRRSKEYEAGNKTSPDVLEPVRDALRRSQDEDVLKVAERVDLAALSLESRVDLAQITFDVASRLYLKGNAELALQSIEKIIQYFSNAPEVALREVVAKALISKGIWLGQAGETDEAFAAYERVITGYGDAPEMVLRNQVAIALFNKGVRLGEVGETDKELAAYESVITSYGDAPEAALRELVAAALYNKGVRLWQAGKTDKALAVCEAVISGYGDAPGAVLRETVARALIIKGVMLGQAGKIDEELATYGRVITGYGDAPETALRVLVVNALYNKGIRLGQAGKTEEALAAYERVITAYGDAPEAELRELVANALFNKGVTLGQAGKIEEALAVFERVITAYSDAPEAALREWVAKALVNKGVALGQAGKTEEALAAFVAVITGYQDAPEAVLREQVASALNGWGFRLLCEAKKHWGAAGGALLGEALEKIEQSLVRKPDEPVVLGNKGYILFLQGKKEEARAILAEAIRLGGDTLRQAELKDAAFHPLPQDEEFKALINSL